MADSYSFDDNAVNEIVTQLRRIKNTAYPLDQQDLTRDGSIPLAIFQITEAFDIADEQSEYTGKGKFLAWTGDPLKGNYDVSHYPPEQVLYYPASTRDTDGNALNVAPLIAGQIVTCCFLGRWVVIGEDTGFWGIINDADRESGQYSWANLSGDYTGDKDDDTGYAKEINGSLWALTGVQVWLQWDITDQCYYFQCPGGAYPCSLSDDVGGYDSIDVTIGTNSDTVSAYNPFSGTIQVADGGEIVVTYGAQGQWWITSQGCNSSDDSGDEGGE